MTRVTSNFVSPSSDTENTPMNIDETPSMTPEVVRKESSTDMNDLASAMGNLDLEQQEKISRLKIASDLDETFVEFNREKLKNIPIQKMPTKLIRLLKLLPYQQQGFSWMVYQERSNEPPPFWNKVDGMWKSSVHGFKNRTTAPKPIHGGILADGT